jgi:hypothetical protein
MICPYLINISLLVGAILSWGVMWPLIDAKKGSWFSADLKSSSLHGLQGYKVAHLSCSKGVILDTIEFLSYNCRTILTWHSKSTIKIFFYSFNKN